MLGLVLPLDTGEAFWLPARESHLSLPFPGPALDSFPSLKEAQPGQRSDQLDILQEQLSLEPPVTARQREAGPPCATKVGWSLRDYAEGG